MSRFGLVSLRKAIEKKLSFMNDKKIIEINLTYKINFEIVTHFSHIKVCITTSNFRPGWSINFFAALKYSLIIILIINIALVFHSVKGKKIAMSCYVAI
jgi:hypothetical protein